MRIFIRSGGHGEGRGRTLEVEPSDTIENAKTMYRDLAGYPPGQDFLFMFAGSRQHGFL